MRVSNNTSRMRVSHATSDLPSKLQAELRDDLRERVVVVVLRDEREEPVLGDVHLPRGLRLLHVELRDISPPCCPPLANSAPGLLLYRILMPYGVLQRNCLVRRHRRDDTDLGGGYADAQPRHRCNRRLLDAPSGAEPQRWRDVGGEYSYVQSFQLRWYPIH